MADTPQSADVVDPARPPGACFATLPLEIKANIVRMAFLQDVAFKTRTAALVVAETKWNVESGGWYGRSGFSLSMVSKELNELAGKHIFETLESGKLQGPKLETFCSLILPRHALDIRTIKLTSYGSNERADAALTLAWAPMLPNLCGLSTTDVSCFSANLHLPSWSGVRSLIRGIGPNITELDLQDYQVVESQNLADVLLLFPSLRRLHFSHDDVLVAIGTEEEAQGSRSFVDSILRQRHLSHLSIRLYRADGLPESWGRLNSDALPQLTSLVFHADQCDFDTHLNFILPFVSQLESLDLSFSYYTAPLPPTSPPSPPTRLNFENLRFLAIAGNEPDEDIPFPTMNGYMFQALSRCDFPLVTTLHLDYDSTHFVSRPQFLNLFPQLEALQLSSRNEYDGPLISQNVVDGIRLEAYSESHRLSTFPRYNPFCASAEAVYEDDDQELEGTIMLHELARLIVFTGSKIQALERRSDFAGAKKLLQFWKGMDTVRALEMD